jgi:hypothetical protein
VRGYSPPPPSPEDRLLMTDANGMNIEMTMKPTIETQQTRS